MSLILPFAVFLGQYELRHTPNRFVNAFDDVLGRLTVKFILEELTMLDRNWKRALLVERNTSWFEKDVKFPTSVGADLAIEQGQVASENVLEIVTLRVIQMSLLGHDMWNVGIEVSRRRNVGHESFEALHRCRRYL